MDDLKEETFSFAGQSTTESVSTFNLSGTDKTSKSSSSINDLEGTFANLMTGQMDLLDSVRRRIFELEIELSAEKAEKAELQGIIDAGNASNDGNGKKPKFSQKSDKEGSSPKQDKESKLPSAGLYYLKIAQKEDDENKTTPSYYRCSEAGAFETTKYEFGPFPSSGLFKLLYHPNGKNVILVSPLLKKTIVAAKELKFDLHFEKDSDVNFTPKRSLLTLSHSQGSDKVIRVQSEFDPELFVEAIFESREIHSPRFSVQSGINCRLRHGSELMTTKSESIYDYNSGTYEWYPVVKTLEPEDASSCEFYKIVFNEDESVSLLVTTSESKDTNINGKKGLTVKSSAKKSWDPSDYLYLTLPGDEGIKICPSKFELFIDKAHGSIRLFTAHGQHFVTKNGKLERFTKHSEVIEFFIEKI